MNLQEETINYTTPDYPKDIDAPKKSPINQEYPKSQETKPLSYRDASVGEVFEERATDNSKDKTPDSLRGKPKKLDSLPKMKPEPNPNKKSPFWAVFSIVTLTILLIGSGVLAFLIDDGKLTPEFNQTVVIKNDPTFSPSINSPVTANIDNYVNNTYELNFDLSDEFLEKVCGNSS